MRVSPLPVLVRWFSRMCNAWRLRALPEHRRRVRSSRRLLRKLHSIYRKGGASPCFGYLRQVDPLVVEEAVLSALEAGGRWVQRNARYTGDGGIDGWVRLRGGWFAVQTKRYQSHIDLADVRSFAALVARRRLRGGLFVHCGRTGKAVYTHLGGSVLLVSGDGLIAMLLHGKLPARDGRATATPRAPDRQTRA